VSSILCTLQDKRADQSFRVRAELKPVFSPVIDKVERLIRKQITGLAMKGHTPKVSQSGDRRLRKRPSGAYG